MENVEAQSNELDEPQMQQAQYPATKPTDDRATKATWATTDFRLKGTAKKFILCVVIAVVWMMLAIPIVMFYLPQDKASDSTTEGSISNLNTCAQTEVYHGDVCREALQDVQSCLMGDQGDGNIYIPASGSQDAIESNAHTLIFSLPLLRPSQECKEAVVPLLCLYLFRLCGVNGSLHQPSSQQCSNVRGNTCALEWETAEKVIGRESLPDCTSLPEHEGLLNCQNTNNDTRSNATATNATADIKCSEDFYFDGSVCRPECGEWEEFSSSTVKTIDALIILVTTIGIITAIAVLVISFIEYKRMLKFPTSLVVYQTFSVLIFGVIVLVGFVDRKSLFCSSRDLFNSFNNPTTFCTISGYATYYILFQMTLWWFCNCVMVFWTITFPFHYRSHKDSRTIKYIHLTVCIGGLILPVVPASVTFATGKYVLTRLPPLVCLPDSGDAPFYTMVLPISMFIAVGVSLLVVVFYNIIKVLQSKDETRMAQAKILFVLVYYIILGGSTMITFTIALRNLTPFVDELLEYFECEAAGTGEPCDRSGFMKHSSPVPLATTYMIIALLPVVNLVYTLNFRKIRDMCLKLVEHKNKHTSTGHSSNHK